MNKLVSLLTVTWLVGGSLGTTATAFVPCTTSNTCPLTVRLPIHPGGIPYHSRCSTRNCKYLKMAESRDATATSPRDLLRRQILIASPVYLLSVTTSSVPVIAKGTEADDKAKILSGYKRLTYLLDNWDKETTICGTKIDPYSGKQICEKNPLIVQEYMGYKSMNDPLFKADKTLRRLEEFVSPDREADFLDAVEKWQMTADEAAGMAYTSSWAGPQNPNGGNDAIEYYLDRAKSQVVSARSILAKVIDILDLKQS